jgi:competence protein ComEC
VTENLYFRPIIPLLVSFIWGIVFGILLPSFGAWVYLIIFICSGLVVYSFVKKAFRRILIVAPIILFSALGYLSIQFWVAPRFPSNHIIQFVDGQKWQITGVIDQKPLKDEKRQKLFLRTETLGHKNHFFPVTGKMRVTVYGAGPELARGDRISFRSPIRSIRNFKNPGGFDYQRYLGFKKIWASTYAQGKRVVILKKSNGQLYHRLMDDARNKISGLIEKTQEGEPRDVLKALIIGERNQISPSLREAFNRAGVGHLLAISGLHIGIVGTVAFLFFNWLFSHFRFFLWHAWTKTGAAILSLLPILIYALLAGMSPSTQRAFIMVSVFMMTFLFKRDQDLINTLALAAMLILVIYPPSLFSISFQLSFTAVFSIIYGLNCLHSCRLANKKTLEGKWQFAVFDKLFTFFMVSIFAIVGTFPLVMLYFNQISLVAPLANLVIVPLIGFWVVPLGLLAVFLYPLSITVAYWCIKGSAMMLVWSLDLVQFFSDLPFAALKTITPSYLEVCSYYLLIWALINSKPFVWEAGTEKEAKGGETKSADIFYDREKTDATQRGYSKIMGCKIRRLLQSVQPGAVSKRQFARMTAVLVFLIFAADVCYWSYQRFWRDTLRVTIIDVGLGNAALLELPDGYCVLVDGGGFADNSVFDMGARIIAPFLWRRKIKTIDTLILSHPNSDHLNGLIYIAKHFNIKNFWSNNEGRNTLGFRKFIEVIEDKKIQLYKFQDMPGVIKINGVEFKIFYPPKDFIEKKEKDTWRTPNNNSLVVKVIYGANSFLFPGDIMAKAERELNVLAGNSLKSTVLLAPHHGSNSSSTAPFLAKVQPQYAIFSVGWRNRFNFPHPSVIDGYEKIGCRIFRTDIHGAITLSTNGESLEITPFVDDGN